MDLSFSAEELSFQREVRAFLKQNLLPSLRQSTRETTTFYPQHEVSREWHSILYHRGWAAPHWPVERGGTGWTTSQRVIWEAECALANAPVISPIGLSLVGPVLFRYGSLSQNAFYLPKILSGEHVWCQGFSEPGAGSDLASLSTRARRDGSDYVVSGSKIWTTLAQHATHMAALVRTGGGGPKQEGISFVAIDMALPGVVVRPILTMAGDHEFNQVFLDEVRVPVVNRIGEEGQGWAIAKHLLEYERGGDIASSRLRVALNDILALHIELSVPGDTLAARQMVSTLAIDIDALEMMELCWIFNSNINSKRAAIPSMLKLRASQLQQAVAELGLQVAGGQALRAREHNIGAAEGSKASFAAKYMNSRANTIFGGSSEIQRTLIFRQIDSPS